MLSFYFEVVEKNERLGSLINDMAGSVLVERDRLPENTRYMALPAISPTPRLSRDIVKMASIIEKDVKIFVSESLDVLVSPYIDDGMGRDGSYIRTLENYISYKG